jgi:hypothetical protein
MSDIFELKQYSYRLYLTFLKNHVKIRTLIPTSQEEDCVKAFCVLHHAALEEYFETLTLKTVNNAYKKYKTKKFIQSLPTTQNEVDNLNIIISQLIKTLVLSSSYSVYSKNSSTALKDHKSKLERVTEIYKNGNNLTLQDVSELTKKSDSYTKDVLKETIKFFDDHVEKNHGASLKYILNLFIPVGIDIPETPLLNSLQKLAEYRGSYAHTQGNLTQIISASDIVVYLIDTIKLCLIIENSIRDFNLYAQPALSPEIT